MNPAPLHLADNLRMTTLDDLNRRSEYLSRAHSAVAFARCLAIGGNLDETVRQFPHGC